MIQHTMMKPTTWQPYQREYQLSKELTLTLGHRTLLMGILNVTPDSFSDGGSTIRQMQHGCMQKT